jgi:hypothetical protein
MEGTETNRVGTQIKGAVTAVGGRIAKMGSIIEGRRFSD